MRNPGKLIGLFVVALAFAAPATANASGVQANLVDGSITAEGNTCTFADASTSANPPDTLTVDAATVKPECGDASVTLNNDPKITFDDANGAATADVIDITGSQSGVECRYKAADVTLNRDGDTRNYAGGPYTGEKVDGSPLCPDTVKIDEASMSFH
ncbi:MAG: hypothetical protein ACRDXX_18275 [Stackebrandtia sp.]